MSSDGILLTAHGSVENLEELPAFLARIRHGRPAPPGLVEEVTRRYRVIGGSPLLRVTAQQASLLAEVTRLPVFIGMRLSRPELATALSQAASAGVSRLCVLPLAPYSVPVYAAAAERALQQLPDLHALKLVAAQPFGTLPELVAAHARRIVPYLSEQGEEPIELVLTAHSLPTSIIAAGDNYTREVEASAHAIGERLGRSCVVAYQSQGADGGAWVGPDLRAVLQRAHQNGKRRIVVAPIGFLCDHVETLYDLDIEAQSWANELGVTLLRVPALNDAPELIHALATVVKRALSH